MRIKRSLISDILYAGFIVAACLLSMVLTMLSGESAWLHSSWVVGIAGTLLTLWMTAARVMELRCDEPKRLGPLDLDWL